MNTQPILFDIGSDGFAGAYYALFRRDLPTYIALISKKKPTSIIHSIQDVIQLRDGVLVRYIDGSSLVVGFGALLF